MYKKYFFGFLAALSIQSLHALYFDGKDVPQSTQDYFTQLQFTPKYKCIGPIDPYDAGRCRRLIYKITARTSSGKKAGFIKVNADNPCFFLQLQVYQFAKDEGVGKKLLEETIAWSKFRGCKQISGIAYSSAKGCYEKLGATCNQPLYDHDYFTTCRYTIPEDKV